MAILTLLDIALEEDPPPPPVLGPAKLRKIHEHSWTMEVLNEGGHVSMSLTCTDPCSVPIDHWTRQTCPCEWVVEHSGELDFYANDFPVRLTSSGGYRDSYSGEWEPVTVEAHPVEGNPT